MVPTVDPGAPGRSRDFTTKRAARSLGAVRRPRRVMTGDSDVGVLAQVLVSVADTLSPLSPVRLVVAIFTVDAADAT